MADLLFNTGGIRSADGIKGALALRAKQLTAKRKKPTTVLSNEIIDYNKLQRLFLHS